MPPLAPIWKSKGPAFVVIHIRRPYITMVYNVEHSFKTTSNDKHSSLYICVGQQDKVTHYSFKTKSNLKVDIVSEKKPIQLSLV